MHFLQSILKFQIFRIQDRKYLLSYIWYKMLSSSPYTMLKLSKTTSPNDNDCVTLSYTGLLFYSIGICIIFNNFSSSFQWKEGLERVESLLTLTWISWGIKEGYFKHTMLLTISWPLGHPAVIHTQQCIKHWWVWIGAWWNIHRWITESWKSRKES